MSREKLLVIQGNARFNRLVSRVAQRAGFDCEIVPDAGAEALRMRLREAAPAVTLLNAGINPGKNRELLKLIAATRIQTPLLIAGGDDPESLTELKQTSAEFKLRDTTFLPYGFDAKILAARLQSIVGHRDVAAGNVADQHGEPRERDDSINQPRRD